MLSKRKASEMVSNAIQANARHYDSLVQQEHDKYTAEVEKRTNLEAQMQQLIQSSNELVNHHDALLNEHANLRAEFDAYLSAPAPAYYADETPVNGQGSTLEFDLIVEQKEPESTYTAVECLGGWAGVIRFDGEIIWQSDPFVAQWMALQAAYEQYKKAKSKGLRLAR